MSSIYVIWLLRLIHIGAGVFWVGGALFFARFLFPAAKTLGPAAAPMMDQLTRVLQVPRALLSAGFVSILAGILLFWHDSSGFQGPWMHTPMARTFSLGGLSAIIAAIIGTSVNAPTAKKLGALGAAIQAQGRPPSPEQAAEMQRLQKRLGGALQIVSLLLVIAVAAMALARYI